MVRRGMKRPAASQLAPSASKKAAKEEKIIANKCAMIARAIEKGPDASELPESVRAMLSDELYNALSSYKDERHPYQVRVAEMVGKAMEMVQTGLEKRIEETAGIADKIVGNESTLITEKDTASKDEDAAKKAAKEALAELKKQKLALKTAKSDLQAAELEAKSLWSEVIGTAGKKDKIEAFLGTFLKPSIEGTVEKSLAKKGLTEFVQIARMCTWGNHCKVRDPTWCHMVASLSSALSDKAENWGTYDKIVIKEFESKLEQMLVDAIAFLDNAEQAKADRAEKVETVKATVTSAEETLKAAESANLSAKVRSKEATAAAKSASNAVKQYKTTVKKASEQVSIARISLDEFKNQALVAFQEMENYAPPAVVVADAAQE